MKAIDCVFDNDVMRREKQDRRFTVVWDMDCTLFDDFGGRIRPGVTQALELIQAKNIKMAIWTNSKRNRALDIIKNKNVAGFFDVLITRESYMLDEIQSSKPELYKKIADAFPREVEFQARYESGKNLTLLGYDFLIDDNKQVIREAEFWKNAYHVAICARFSPAFGGLIQPEEIVNIAKRAVHTAKPPFPMNILRSLGIGR